MLRKPSAEVLDIALHDDRGVALRIDADENHLWNHLRLRLLEAVERPGERRQCRRPECRDGPGNDGGNHSHQRKESRF